MTDIEFILDEMKTLAEIVKNNALTIAAIGGLLDDHDRELTAIRDRLTLIEKNWE